MNKFKTTYQFKIMINIKINNNLFMIIYRIYNLK